MNNKSNKNLSQTKSGGVLPYQAVNSSSSRSASGSFNRESENATATLEAFHKAKKDRETLLDACKGMLELWFEINRNHPNIEIDNNGFNGSTDFVGRTRQAIEQAS